MRSPPTKANLDTGVNESKSLTDRTLSGFFWMLSGSGIQAVLRTLVLVILARLLTPEDFGLAGAALIIVGFSALFSQLGMGPAIVQRPSLEERHLRTGFTVSMLFGVLIGGLIAISAPLIAGFFRMDGLLSILRIIAIVFPIQGLTVVASGLLKRELHFRWLAGIDIVSYMVGYGVIGITLAAMGFGVWALIGANLAAAGIKATMLLFVQPHPKRPQLEGLAFRELMYFGGGFTIARVLNYTALQGDNLVAGRWLGAEALGIYGRAYQLLVFPVNLISSMVDQVLFPSMAKIQDDPQRLEAAYRRGISLIALVFAPISVAALVLAPELILVLLGPAWIEVVDPFRILAVGMLFRASYKMSDSVARATGAVYKRAWRQGIYALFVVVGAWIGQHWGVTGVATGVLVALTVNFILMAHLSFSLTAMTWQRFLMAHLPALLLAAFTLLEIGAIVSLLRNLTLPALIILLASSAVTGVTLLILLYSMPQILGPDGKWMLRTLTGFVARRLDRLGWIKGVVRKNAY
jgi:O-antigen/teichoic acid export membrane protein